MKMKLFLSIFNEVFVCIYQDTLLLYVDAEAPSFMLSSILRKTIY